MRRCIRRVLNRYSPWRRDFDEGFDGGIRTAAAYVDRLLTIGSSAIITRDDLRELAAQIRRELP
jgi:hypothetical protein